MRSHFIPAILIAASLLAGLMGGCGYKSPPGFYISVAEIQPGQLEPYETLPSAREDALLFLCNPERGTRPGANPKIAAAYTVSFTGKSPAIKPVIKQLAAYDLRENTFLRCMLPDGGIVLDEDLSTSQPLVWYRKDELVEGITPKNFNDVRVRDNRQYVSTRDCDYAANLYAFASREDGSEEMWVGSKTLKRVTGLPRLICTGSCWDESGRRILVVTEDGHILKIDGTSAKPVDSPELAWAADAIANDTSVQLSRLRRLIMVNGLAYTSFGVGKERAVKVYSQTGKVYLIRLFSSVDETPSGRKRSDAEAQWIIDKPHALVSESRHLPPDMADRMHFTAVCLDRERIALVDTAYYRAVIIQAALATR